ncbi:MAG: hypothetical protein ACREAY_10825 [Nitrososphaera sp.]|uniref:hypothetical protein n=1 Tax=Nitrososphaera sp. TaxID=1971748 RepID=UPI003D6E406D
MKASRPLAFVVLAFVVGATISQASFAFADDSSTNPFRAIWDAISELQTRTDSLQAQIDDLKELRGAATAEPAVATRISEPAVAIEVGSGQAGRTTIQVIARNAGPENAVGVKLSTYYQTSLFSVNSIQGAECTDQARGIIECYLGTLDVGSEARITIDATPTALGQQAMITSDISSITDDANPANNHAEAVFITSEAPTVIAPVAQPEQAPAEQQVPQQPAEGRDQPAELSSAPAEQPVEQQGEQSEQPAEEQTQQPPEEQQEQPSQEQPAEEQTTAPSGGESSTPPAEAPSSSGGESSGGAGSEPAAGGESSPPPPPPSGGEATG